MTEPQDQSERLRFATELDRNFSVVASAGSGKTRAVTDRIVQLAKSRDAVKTLPRLIVLTFANRAADEMQQRAREEMLRARLSPEVLGAFNRAWFGTIHAFCFKLLNEYGHYLGLPAPLELLADDEDLWSEFIQQQTLVGRSLSENAMSCDCDVEGVENHPFGDLFWFRMVRGGRSGARFRPHAAPSGTPAC